jgi:site-specific recombinase XerD
MIGCRPLNDEEIKKCMRAFAGHKYELRNRALFVLGLNTGFRIRELLSLKIKDVRPYKEITDYLTVNKKNMKGNISSRTVVLSDICKQYLREYLDNFETLFELPADREYYLFKSQKGENQPISTRQGNEILYEVFEANELGGKLSSHAMRKTFAKKIHESLDRDITKTQVALGHRDISSTQHYLSFDNDEVSNAMRNLNIGAS